MNSNKSCVFEIWSWIRHGVEPPARLSLAPHRSRGLAPTGKRRETVSPAPLFSPRSSPESPFMVHSQHEALSSSHLQTLPASTHDPLPHFRCLLRQHTTSPYQFLALISCCNQIPQTGKLINRNVFLTVLKAGKFKVKVLADCIRFIDGCLFTSSSHDGWREPSWGPLWWGHWSHSWVPCTHDIITSQKPHLLIPSHWRLQSSLWICGYTGIQSRTPRYGDKESLDGGNTCWRLVPIRDWKRQRPTDLVILLCPQPSTQLMFTSFAPCPGPPINPTPFC